MIRAPWILIGGLALLAGPGESAGSDRPPNIVVIVADDMGYGDIGAYGGTDIPTPNIDALAAGGIRFTDAYVSGPYCSPTRAGLLTGRYPQRFGHEFNIGMMPAHRDVGLPLDQATMADRLKAAGYRTALFGKWHLGTAQPFFPTRRGFDEFFGFLTGAHSYIGASAQMNPIFDGNEIVRTIPYLTDTLASRAVDFIQRNGSQPFFLYLAFNAVHGPLQATEKYLARVSRIANPQRRTYAAMLSAMDDGIGRTLEALRAEHLEEQTLIFFFSDNGGPQDSDWNGSSNRPLRGDKATTWEGGIRVPFVMRWKGRLPEGRTDGRPIIQLDVLPTALAAAGVAAQPDWHLDGVDLLPFLTGAASGAPHDALYWRLGSLMAIRMGDWKLVKVVQGGASDDPAKLTLEGAELFNVRSDVSERDNLATRHPDRAKDLADAWQRWNRGLAPPGWPPPQGYRGAPRGCLDQTFAATPIVPYAGTWRGAMSPLVGVTWMQGNDSTGAFTIGGDNPVPTRIVFVSTDSIVADLTRPVRGPNSPDDLSLRVVASVCGEELIGLVSIRGSDGSVRRVPLTATREPR
jgi:arylsulfatase A-like enzyme